MATAIASAIDEAVPVIGVLCGGDGAKEIVWDQDRLTNSVGNNDSLQMLKYLHPAIGIKRMHLAPSYFRQVRRYNFSNCDMLWNAISDEIQNPKTLSIAQKIANETKLPIVNPPAMVPRTSRAEIARRLQGIDGVSVPKVLIVRNPTLERVGRMVRDTGFAFPAIVRRTGTHNGQVVGIFDNLESLEPIFGDRKNEYNLIEFVDIRRKDGHYRKTRFFFIGDQALIRQHVVSDQWSVHGRDSRRLMGNDEGLRDEARDLMVNGLSALPLATREAIHKIRERVGLDYCGLDCCLMEDGQIVVFESNATMNFNPAFSNPATQYNRACFPRLLSALRRLIHSKSGKGEPY
jgi:glutathione synthase/RimK-type ligase-like ATP-grasp enzyme